MSPFPSFLVLLLLASPSLSLASNIPDLSTPPRVISPEIVEHLERVAEARGWKKEKKGKASSSPSPSEEFALAHAALLSRVAAQGGTGRKSSDAVGEDGGREMVRSVLSSVVGEKEGEQQRAVSSETAEAAAEAALAAGKRRGAVAAKSALAVSSTVKLSLEKKQQQQQQQQLSDPSSSSLMWLPKPRGVVLWGKKKKEKAGERKRVEVDEL